MQWKNKIIQKMKKIIINTILLILGLGIYSCVDSSNKIETQNKAVVKQYLEELISNADFTNADKLIDPEMTFYANGEAIPLKGLEFIKSFTEDESTAFSYIEIIDEEIIAEGNTVASRWYVKGIHDKGEYQGIPAGNKEFKYDGMSFYKLENGLIKEAYLIGNELLFMKQIGGIPTE